MRAIQIEEFGGPEVLRVVEVDPPQPQPGQVRVAVTAAGVNYADTHQVENSYLAPATLPLVPGAEVVGTTDDGRRVIAFLERGGYAEQAAAWEPLVFDVPDGVEDGQALALMVQGLSAWHLLRTSAHLAEGETVVVHAAAGGVGTIAVQLARRFGAGRIIASASTPEKRALAMELGADAAVDPGDPDLKDALQEANGGRKVDVVLEMTGGPVLEASLAALAPFGRLVTYGMASRVPPRPIHAGELMSRSRAIVGFWLAHCMTKPGMMGPPLAELFGLVGSGALRPIVGGTYPLADAPRAHEDLRARRSTGKLLLDVTA